LKGRPFISRSHSPRFEAHVALRNIKFGRDFGGSVGVVAGLAPTDRVIDSPPDTIIGIEGLETVALRLH